MTLQHVWEQRRIEVWQWGAAHREYLMAENMGFYGLSERPLVKDIVDAVIMEIQGARLVEGALPLDTYAQTQLHRGRLEVTVNSRIHQMDGVGDPERIAHVAKWHESADIARDFAVTTVDGNGKQPTLPGWEVPVPRLVVCRRAGRERGKAGEREFFAENAAHAAAIAGPDLLRCDAFHQLAALVERGRELGGTGWRALYETAEFIGVNINAISRYFARHGFLHIDRECGAPRLYPGGRLFGGFVWP